MTKSKVNMLDIYWIIGDASTHIRVYRGVKLRQYVPTQSTLRRCIKLARSIPNHRTYETFLEAGIVCHPID